MSAGAGAGGSCVTCGGVGIVGGVGVVSFVGGILLRDWLDANLPSIGSAPFGFWIAQQGSIICFVLILISYAVLMNRLDNKHGYWEDK